MPVWIADSVKKHAAETMDTGGDTGFILAPGCDLPFHCPEENLSSVTEIVHDAYQRDVFRTMASSAEKVDSSLELINK